MALIVTEGSQPSEDGQGYQLTPGVFTEAQIAGWQEVTSAVHAAGGRIVVQLMHVGRVSHPDKTPHHRQPVAPSAIRPAGAMFTAAGLQDMRQPRALSTGEVADVVEEFRRAASAAIAAGFDGAVIHGGDEPLLRELRDSWPSALVLNRAGAALNEPDPATIYGGDARGYTDYPALTAAGR